MSFVSLACGTLSGRIDRQRISQLQKDISFACYVHRFHLRLLSIDFIVVNSFGNEIPVMGSMGENREPKPRIGGPDTSTRDLFRLDGRSILSELFPNASS